MSLTMKMAKSKSGQIVRSAGTVRMPGSFTPYPRVPRPAISRAALRATIARNRGMGDPGLFGFLGDVVGGVAKTVGGILPGPIGAGVSALGGLIDPDDPPMMFQEAPGLPPMRGKKPGIRAGIERLAPGGETGMMYSEQQLRKFKNRAGSRIPWRSGYRWNKSDYWLKDGTFVPAGAKPVKIRKRNAMNPRALDRAMSRLNSAKRLQSKLSGYSTAKYTASGRKKAKC